MWFNAQVGLLKTEKWLLPHSAISECIKSITQSMASNSHLSVTAFSSEMFFSVLCKCFMVYVCLIWFMFF